MNSFAIKTFGCKVAQADEDKLREFMINHGFYEEDPFDYLILNGCAVTQRAESKARAWARAFKRKYPKSVVIIYGCVAQKEKRFSSNKEAYWDYAVAHDDFEGLKSILISLGAEMSSTKDILLKPSRIRPFIKIHDGCNQYCDYCIVPYLRGDERSIPPDAIIEEIQPEYPEIVLTGIHIGRYNHQGLTLSGLIRQILAKTDVPRIRLSSIEPNEFDEDLLELILNENRIARYLHIPLQSGSDRILDKMGRPYTANDFQSLIEAIITKDPDFGIGTDVIIGYPEETEDDFAQTRALLKNLSIFNIHQFGYSPRPGTPSADRPIVYTGEQRKDRSNRILDLSNAKRAEFLGRYVHRSQKYIIEQFDGKYYHGTASNYIQMLTERTDIAIGKEYELEGISIKGEKLLCR